MLLGLRGLAAILLAALLLAGVDLGVDGVTELLFVAGGLALLASPLAALAPLLARLGPAHAKGPARWATAGALVLVPLAPVVIGRGGEMFSLSSLTLVTLVLLPVTGLFVSSKLLALVWGEPDARGWWGLALAAIVSL
jgi:hypothetical protein